MIQLVYIVVILSNASGIKPDLLSAPFKAQTRWYFYDHRKTFNGISRPNIRWVIWLLLPNETGLTFKIYVPRSLTSIFPHRFRFVKICRDFQQNYYLSDVDVQFNTVKLPEPLFLATVHRGLYKVTKIKALRPCTLHDLRDSTHCPTIQAKQLIKHYLLNTIKRSIP